MTETLEQAETLTVEEPIVRPKQKRRTKGSSKTKKQPPYVVIVHNDNDHTFDYVIEMLLRVCGHPLERAVQLTSEVHHTGRAVVWTGSLEVAELKRDQIHGYGPDFYASKTVRYPIGVSIEPLSD